MKLHGYAWLGLLLVACDEESPAQDKKDEDDTSFEESASESDDDDDDDDDSEEGTSPAPKDAAVKPASKPGADAGVPVQTEVASATGELAAVPCEVAEITTKYCSACHGATPAGSPMSLVSWNDFQAKSKSGAPYYELAAKRIHDTAKPMPPPGRDVPTADEQKVLDAWFGKKGPKSTEKCNAKVPNAPDTGGFDWSQCDKMFEVRAHGAQQANDTTPYKPAKAGDHYECFLQEVPWDDKMHILHIEPIIDDKRVLHHYLLYQDRGTSAGNGTHQGCVGVHPNSALLTGWAPGGQALTMPADVGLQSENRKSGVFNLEIHYYNDAYPDAADRSGVKICATSKLRKNEATTHWLGTEALILLPGKTDAGSTCNPQVESHILFTSPHMHKLGRHMKTEIKFKDGKKMDLTDRPFAFTDQQIYPAPGGEIVVGPGDSLTTTCTFENDGSGLVTFGPNTSQEMCYNFVTAWPAGSLGTGGSLIGGPNKCML